MKSWPFLALFVCSVPLQVFALDRPAARACYVAQSEIRDQSTWVTWAAVKNTPNWGEAADKEMHAKMDSIQFRAKDCAEILVGLKALTAEYENKVLVEVAGPVTRPRRGSTVRYPLRGRAKIVILTDEASGKGADIVKQTFLTTAPYKCMGLDFEVRIMPVNELDCRPHPDGRRGIIECSAEATALGNAVLLETRAKRVLIVTEHDEEGGNGGAIPVVTTAILKERPKAGIHELMHTMGFEDTYEEGEFTQLGGAIMKSTDKYAYVPKTQWSSIARTLGIPNPTECPN